MNFLRRIASSRSDFLAQKYPKVPSSTIEEMEQADPSRGKALEWLVRQVNNSAIRWPEDASRATEALQTFFTLKKSPKLLKQHSVSTDLNSYNFHSLEEIHRKVHGTENRQSLLSEIPKGAEKVYDDGKYAVVKVTTPEAASALADSTSWCTRHPETAAVYMEKGPLFVFFENGKKFAQADSNGQFMDINDKPVNIEDKSLLNIYLKIPKANPKTKIPGVKDLLLGKAAPESLALYAVKVLRHRWPEAEPTIKLDGYAAYIYANDILRKRWPEAEPSIATDPVYAYYYARDILKRRWPEAEPSILNGKEKMFIYGYAVNIIKGRWREAEPLILEDTSLAFSYFRNIVKGRWPEAEPVFSQDPHLFATYKQILSSF